MMKEFEFLGTTKKGIVQTVMDGILFEFDSRPLTEEEGQGDCHPYFLDDSVLCVSGLTDVGTGWRVDLNMKKVGVNAIEVVMTVDINRYELTGLIAVDNALSFLEALGDSVKDRATNDKTVSDVLDSWIK